jgi:hypothetical protein
MRLPDDPEVLATFVDQLLENGWRPIPLSYSSKRAFANCFGALA